MSAENRALLDNDNRVVFELLLNEGLTSKKIRAQLDINASTCARCLGELEDAKLIDFEKGKWIVTYEGREAHKRYFG